jgi:hypothetical protein
VTPTPPVDLTGRVREIERETIRQKALVVDVVRAVLRADPARLPPGVAEARLKLMETVCATNPASS